MADVPLIVQEADDPRGDTCTDNASKGSRGTAPASEQKPSATANVMTKPIPRRAAVGSLVRAALFGTSNRRRRTRKTREPRQPKRPARQRSRRRDHEDDHREERYQTAVRSSASFDR